MGKCVTGPACAALEREGGNRPRAREAKGETTRARPFPPFLSLSRACHAGYHGLRSLFQAIFSCIMLSCIIQIYSSVAMNQKLKR